MSDGEQPPLVILTVDAEEEWNWSSGLPTPPYSTENIRRIPEFQKRCSAVGLVPTYFVDSAVLEVEENKHILADHFKNGDCDIGAQLHPWCTAPLREPLSDWHSHSINLDKNLVAEKLHTLTEQIFDAFAVHPFSFRCGRWGMNGVILRMLAQLGYSVDSSVRPYYSTEHFSYAGAPNDPYWPSFNDICSEGNQRDILELPVADGFSSQNFENMAKWYKRLDRTPFRNFRMLGILAQLNIFRKIVMSPEVTNAAGLCRCIDLHVARGNPVITLFMHSSDLLPGATSYTRDEAGVDRFISVLEQCANHLHSKHGAQFVGIREAHAILMSRENTT